MTPTALASANGARQWLRARHASSSAAFSLRECSSWAVVSDLNRGSRRTSHEPEEAEAVVQAWDRDEPEQVGTLRVEAVEFETSPN
jgi:hypothetical protein